MECEGLSFDLPPPEERESGLRNSVRFKVRCSPVETRVFAWLVSRHHLLAVVCHERRRATLCEEILDERINVGLIALCESRLTENRSLINAKTLGTILHDTAHLCPPCVSVLSVFNSTPKNKTVNWLSTGREKPALLQIKTSGCFYNLSLASAKKLGVGLLIYFNRKTALVRAAFLTSY